MDKELLNKNDKLFFFRGLAFYRVSGRKKERDKQKGGRERNQEEREKAVLKERAGKE